MGKLDIIAQHRDFIVAYKPCGMSFHSENEAGFVALLEKQLDKRLYPVHRLDKVTSGLLVLATSSESASELTRLFTERLVSKFYLALITDKPKKKQGWVKGDMAKSRRGTFKLLKTQENPAITRFYSSSVKAGLRACLMKPFSGKTHQLRVALKSLSAPILGDESYGGSESDRVYLHAYYIAFDWHGEHVNYSAEPKEGAHFMQLLTHDVFNSWRQPEQLEW
ncbi:TIGR01621 family pseudouridine synthase [Pseudoalteromonas luteoviolacea]|uniref:TIGR01621 family pseudouridine synthase n=1 Tax=Pseudoalteromonas luteoviolacea TaxID=43657 RepID=UPI001B37516A|nr:TIGR01621 family pseudouridine synthase [Pseudoalteromonas luteoviolacea]MBQ4812587.1 TIGR01621 family pseudouridine synthase [Pseudoalteromonas luteoviolacea]